MGRRKEQEYIEDESISRERRMIVVDTDVSGVGPVI